MNWQAIWNDYINTSPGIVAVALRLGCAMLIGALIGLEREYTHRPAGLRTHILVALGACVASLMGEMLVSNMAPGADPARLSAQVITGVGFLGAGTIMKEGASVKGLTTAASVWAVACLGIAAGFGYYTVSLLGTVLILVTLTLVEALQHRLIHAGSSKESYVMETTDLSTAITQLYAISQSQNVLLSNLSVRQTEQGHQVRFRAAFSGRRHKKHHGRFLAALIAVDGIDSIQSASEVKV